MSTEVQTELERIESNVAAAYAAATEQGADLPASQNSDNLALTVAGIKTVKFTEQSLSEAQQTQARQNIGAASQADLNQLSLEKVNEPADNDIPKVFLTGEEFSNMTTEKNEVNMELEYHSKTERFRAFIAIKYQGNTSLRYDKKNFTVKMFSDASHEIKLKKKFRNWKYAKHKYVLKANFIDHSHWRNIGGANLWSQIVASRSDYDTLPEGLRNSPNNGAVDGFPIKLYVNGTYQGIYTWNIGKDDWMWGMDEDNTNHALVGFGHNSDGEFKLRPYNFRALWNGVGTDGSYVEIEIGTAGTAITTALNNLIRFVMDNDGEDFRNGIGAYLDIQSAIDYYIFAYADCGLDGLGKNMLLATYDMKVWRCGMYDMDCIFGLYWDGSKFVSATYKCPEDYQEKFSLLWERIEANFWPDVQSRYAELRQNVLTESNMFTIAERFTDAIGSTLYAEDLEIYPTIPCGSTNNIKQLRNYIRDRLAYCDQQITNGIPGTGVVLSQTELAMNTEAVTLKATVTPNNTTDTVLWLSSDASVATVNNGVVTPVSDGSCTIRAKCGSGYGVCEVTVSTVVEPDEPETPTYTNLVPTAIDTDGSIFNGTGYKQGYRVSSSGSIKSASDTTKNVCIGYLPAKSGDVFRVKNMLIWDLSIADVLAADGAIALFDSTFKHLGTACFQSMVDYSDYTRYGIFSTSNLASPIKNMADGITTIEIPNVSNIAYVVICGRGTGANVIVTKNEEIN